MTANYSITSAGYDATFELNEFNEPRIRSDLETVKDVLLFILFSKPGSYPSIPMIGLDIESRLYEFFDEFDEEQLKSDLIQQCSMLGAYISSETIMIKKVKYRNRPSLIIHIEGTETFPDNYKYDKITENTKYLVGITYDDMNKLVYNVNGG